MKKSPMAAIPSVGTAMKAYEFYKENPFTEAHHNANLTGQYLAILTKELNIFNNNTICVLGFSLGTLLTFTCLTTLYDMNCLNKIGDVCLMGSVIDETAFYNNVHKLIGPNGVI